MPCIGGGKICWKISLLIFLGHFLCLYASSKSLSHIVHMQKSNLKIFRSYAVTRRGHQEIAGQLPRNLAQTRMRLRKTLSAHWSFVKCKLSSSRMRGLRYESHPTTFSAFGHLPNTFHHGRGRTVFKQRINTTASVHRCNYSMYQLIHFVTSATCSTMSVVPAQFCPAAHLSESVSASFSSNQFNQNRLFKFSENVNSFIISPAVTEA